MPAEFRAFRCLQDNVGALVHDPATGACAAVDAPEEGPIVEALEAAGWRLTDILVTHRHADHVQAIEPLKRRYGCRVTAPAKAGSQVPGVDRVVREGDHVSVGGLTAQVMETPGHCRDHIALWFEEDETVFAGDTLFTLGCGRVLEGSYDDMWTSLQRLSRLPEATRVYCGHDYSLSNARFALAADPDNEALKARTAEAERARDAGGWLIPTTVAAEKRTNPFLRAGEPALARAVHLEGRDPAAVFQALREWKNRF